MTDVCKIIIHWLNLIIMKKSKKMPQILFLRSFWRMRSPSQARRSRNAQNELLGRREFGTWWWAHLSYNMVNLSFGLLLYTLHYGRRASSHQGRTGSDWKLLLYFYVQNQPPILKSASIKIYACVVIEESHPHSVRWFRNQN